MNIEGSVKFPDATPAPLEIPGAIVWVCALKNGDWEWEKKGAIEFGVKASVSVPDWSFKVGPVPSDPASDKRPGVAVDGTAIELGITVSIEPEWRSLAGKLKTAAGKAWTRGSTALQDLKNQAVQKGVKPAAEYIGEVADSAGEKITLWLTEDGEMTVAAGLLDVAITVATVIAVILGVAAVIYLIDEELDVNGLVPARDQAVGDLTKYFVMGLNGQPLTEMPKQDSWRQAHIAGDKRRTDLKAQYGDQFDSWIADNDNSKQVVDGATAQFKSVICDKLWAAFASNHSQAIDQWTAWNTLYSRVDPLRAKKMDIFTKYAKGAYFAPDGYLSGDWTTVSQTFNDRSA